MSTPCIYPIKPNNGDIHQVSPSWMLTFIRWRVRDPLRSKSGDDPSSVLEPLVVINDCIQLNTADTKNSPTPAFSAILKGGDTNYSAAVAPGDFCFVNIVNDDTLTDFSKSDDPKSLEYRAQNKLPINRFDGKINDGFKGVYKVHSVRRHLSVDPITGVKQLQYQIQGYAFTELNNMIYFNPYAFSDLETNNASLWITSLGDLFHEQLMGRITNVGVVLNVLINALLGPGFNRTTIADGVVRIANRKFLLPETVGKLLGHSSAQYVSQIIDTLIGVQLYGYPRGDSWGAKFNSFKSLTNPSSETNLKGTVFIKCQPWNQVTCWSILHQFLNSIINEMYTTFRVNEDGLVVPTLVIRQIPFSVATDTKSQEKQFNSIGASKYKDMSIKSSVTKFLTLPRWSIDTGLIYSLDLGRDEAARVNFVQVFGQSDGQNDTTNKSTISSQMILGNIVFDPADIERNGLKPQVMTSNFDLKTTGQMFTNAPEWTKIIGEWMIGGHLKENGTIVCQGISEPICIGDNFELDDTVFHIEEVHHQCSINMNGVKQFRTTLRLSHGIDKDSDSNDVLTYPEMEDRQSMSDVLEDDNLGIYPGVSDTQYTRSHNSSGENDNQIPDSPSPTSTSNINSVPKSNIDTKSNDIDVSDLES
jgi:hypothetical protein